MNLLGWKELAEYVAGMYGVNRGVPNERFLRTLHRLYGVGPTRSMIFPAVLRVLPGLAHQSPMCQQSRLVVIIPALHRGMDVSRPLDEPWSLSCTRPTTHWGDLCVYSFDPAFGTGQVSNADFWGDTAMSIRNGGEYHSFFFGHVHDLVLSGVDIVAAVRAAARVRVREEAIVDPVHDTALGISTNPQNIVLAMTL